LAVLKSVSSDDCIADNSDRDGANDHSTCGERVGLQLGATAFLSVLLIAIFELGSALQRVARRLVRFSLEDLQRVDARRPILFLRAFGDDQVAVKPEKAPVFTRFIEFGRRHTSLDQLLLEEGTPYGPVVGLGNPHDKHPPYGAARGYFDDKDWQDAVTDLSRNSLVVLICLDDTPSLLWEIEHLVTNGHVAKTLFLVHPKFAKADSNQPLLLQMFMKYGDHRLLGALMKRAPSQARKGQSETVLGFFVGKDDVLHVVRSSTFSQLSYLLTLRLFLHEKLAVPIADPPKADVRSAAL
jgi:hypothetical protein